MPKAVRPSGARALVVLALFPLLLALSVRGQEAVLLEEEPAVRSHSPAAEPSGARPVVVARAARQMLKERPAKALVKAVPLISGKHVDFDLERFEVLREDSQLVAFDGTHATPLARPDLVFYRGRSAAGTSETVFLSLSDGEDLWMMARDQNGEQTFVVPDHSNSAPQHFLAPADPYALSQFLCGFDLIPQNQIMTEAQAQAQQQPSTSPDAPATAAAYAPDQTLEAELLVDVANNLFTGAFGSSTSQATSYVTNLVGAASAIYQRDLNIVLSVKQLVIWTTPDSFDGANSYAQLTSYQNYNKTNRAGVARDVCVLMANRTGYGGIAYMGTLCSSGYGYAVTNLFGNARFPVTGYYWDVDVLSHELGHNFSSPHTHCYSPPIDCCYNAESGCNCGTVAPTVGTIMSYCHLVATTNLVFHDRVKTKIREFAQTAACLAPYQPPGGVVVRQDDSFTTDVRTAPGSASGWSPLGLTSPTLVSYDWDATNHALRGRVESSAPATSSAYRYRCAGWVSNQAEWMPYSSVGTGNYVRVKYSMYATDQANPANLNQIPNFRLRAASRFAVTSSFECLHHDLADPGNLAYAQELRPSTDVLNPSVYRVDIDPVDVPYLQANAAHEGILRGFDAFAFDPGDNGYIGMAESVIGTYPASLVPDSVAPLQVYQTSTSDAGDLKIYNSAAELQIYNFVFPAGTAEGQMPLVSYTGVGSYSEGPAGVKLDTSSVASSAIGIVTRDFNPDRETLNYAAHPRVEEGKQYKIRFHVTSTQQSNQNAPLWLRSRAVKFAWSQKLELGGPWAAGTANNAIAQQTLPGIGCANPDRSGSERGGWYTLLMNTPMSSDIRPEFAAGAPLATRMPKLAAEPGPGVAAASRRDIRVGVSLVDTLDFTPNGPLEKGSYTIDRIEVRAYSRVGD